MGGGFGMEHAYAKLWGQCIVSTQRIVVQWDNGDITQYPLSQIRGVHVSDGDYTRRFKKDYPGIMRIELDVPVKRFADPWEETGRWETTSARKLASEIQKALMPF
jgi:hypothetical protein